ncbi:TPA: ead/Ea22-like family protein [Enterobacter hormaechei subsp. steigerwaltii]|nr:ead/Ea22-like family protein [Enterobacter hormaechei subsp. steigerwaltii]
MTNGPMSNIDKRALREAADAANKSSWGRWESYHPHKGARGYEVKVGVKAVAQHCLKVDSVFIAAANPATVLALLDELEAKDRRLEEEIGRANREHHRGFMMACGHLKDHSNVHYADAAEMEIAALRKRINELENAAAGKGE